MEASYSKNFWFNIDKQVLLKILERGKEKGGYVLADEVLKAGIYFREKAEKYNSHLDVISEKTSDYFNLNFNKESFGNNVGQHKLNTENLRAVFFLLFRPDSKYTIRHIEVLFKNLDVEKNEFIKTSFDIFFKKIKLVLDDSNELKKYNYSFDIDSGKFTVKTNIVNNDLSDKNKFSSSKKSIPKDNNNTSDENEKIVHIKAKTVYIESQNTTPTQTKKDTNYTKKMLLGFGVIFCFIIIFSFFDKPKIKKDTIIENNDSITIQDSNQTKNKRRITNVPIPEKINREEVNLECCAKSKNEINKLTKDFKAKNKSNIDIAFLDTKLIILKQIDLSCTETDCNICMVTDNLNNEIANFSYVLIKNEGEKIKENQNYSDDYTENIQLLLKTLELSLYICERTDCLKEDCLSYREIYDNYSKTLN